MNGPGTLGRFALLMGLRFRLVLRSVGRSAGRAALFAVSLLGFGMMAVLVGVNFWHRAQAAPGVVDTLAHTVFFGLFVAQVVLGVVTLVVSEFYDVSRLLHLPVTYKEVFAAMAASGFFAPVTLLYAAPVLGVAAALPGGALTWLLRPVAFLALFLLGHGLALLLNLVFLSFLSRRRLRDLATIVASVIGVSFYIAFRGFGPGRGPMDDVLLNDPTAKLRWLPSAWLADVFLGRIDQGALLLRLGGVLALLSLVFLLGARALKAAFLGQVASPKTGAVTREGKRTREFLPADLATMVSAIRSVYFREPQVKALYIQQTVFMLAPLAFMIMDDRASFSRPHVLGMLPFLLALSHMMFFQSFFGLDGRGIVQLLMTPVPRYRILLARGIAVGGFFLVADFVISILALAVMGMASGSWSRLLPETWRVYLVVVLVDLVMLSFGTVTSVRFPFRIASAGRRAVQGQRAENTGCTAQLVRMALFLPAAGTAFVLALVALLPTFEGGLFGLRLPGSWLAVTVPLTLAIALLTYGLVVGIMSRVLERREEELVRALADSGE